MKKQILIIVLALLISGGLVYNTMKNAISHAYSKEYDAAARDLRIARGDLETELGNINAKLAKVVIGKGAGVFIFEELYEELYTDIVPVMQDYGYTGVMALSLEYLPGKEECITMDQFLYLISCGWTTCIMWDDYIPLDTYLEELRGKLDELGIVMPDVIYVENGDYYSYKDEEFQAAGFTTVIHHGEDTDLVAREDTTELFHIGALPWDHPMFKRTLDETISYGGSLTMYVDFSTNYGMFVEELFRVMCDYLKENENRFYITDIQGARENLSMVETNEYLVQRKKYLESEIARYDEEISAIYELDLREVHKENKKSEKK